MGKKKKGSQNKDTDAIRTKEEMVAAIEQIIEKVDERKSLEDRWHLMLHGAKVLTDEYKKLRTKLKEGG